VSSKDDVRRLLEKAKNAVEVKSRVKLVLYPMKYKVASISLKTGVIRLNKNLLELFTDEELYYILIHELLHIKHATLNHGEEFYKSLYTLYTLEDIERLENSIAKKLIYVYIKAKKWLT